MKKIILSSLLIIYMLMVLTTTFLLTKYNEFGIIEFDEHLVLTSNKTDIKYRKGSLLIIKKEEIKNIKEDDNVFYYTADRHKILVSQAKVKEISVINEDETTFGLSNNKKYSSSYIIGRVSLVKIPILGYLIRILTSKIGYLVIIILPISAFFLAQMCLIFKRK